MFLHMYLRNYLKLQPKKGELVMKTTIQVCEINSKLQSQLQLKALYAIISTNHIMFRLIKFILI